MQLENAKILVTGATGFVGARLAQKLKEQNADVTILVRKKPENTPYKTIVGDLTDSNLHFDQSFDVVCHLASCTPLEKDKKILHAVNYEGTRNLYSAVLGAKLFVYVSGLAVFDHKYKTITEETPKIHDTEFVKIRIDAQKFLEENCKNKGMDLVVAHLADIVYGNGGFFKLMISDRLSKETFRIPGDGKYMKNFIHVDDAACAISAIIQKGDKGTYLLTDSTPVPFKEFVNYLADCMKVKRPKTVPAVLAKLVLSSDAINLLMRSTIASNKKIRQIYDFKFPSYKEGIVDLFP